MASVSPKNVNDQNIFVNIRLFHMIFKVMGDAIGADVVAVYGADDVAVAMVLSDVFYNYRYFLCCRMFDVVLSTANSQNTPPLITKHNNRVTFLIPLQQILVNIHFVFFLPHPCLRLFNINYEFLIFLNVSPHVHRHSAARTPRGTLFIMQFVSIWFLDKSYKVFVQWGELLC